MGAHMYMFKLVFLYFLHKDPEIDLWNFYFSFFEEFPFFFKMATAIDILTNNVEFPSPRPLPTIVF